MSRPLAVLNLPLPPFIAELFQPHCEFRPWQLLEQGSQADLAAIQALVIYGHPHVDDAVLDRVPNVKVISNFGVGVDHIDVKAAARRGIPVGNTPGAVDNATADMTMTLLLSLARNVVSGDRFARSPGWARFDPSDLPGKEVYGATLGIIGLGRIGKQVAKRAKGFDMKILYHRRHRDPEAEQALGVEYADLDTLLSRADFVTLNVPLTPDTRGLIGAAQLRKMRKDAMLINIARGGVLDHAALTQALSERWIAAAALDVTEPEPLPRDHPLLKLDNLIITPHLGSATVATRRRMGQMMVDNLVAGLAGKPLPYQVKG
ncbi:MAG: D-glycerate dehydrogenase [Gammaproteobacteria bacterium]